MSVEIPKMAVAFGQYGIPQGDIIECRVHLGCTKEVSSFDLLLQNWNGKYSPGGSIPLAVGMDGHIDIGRGANVPQIITCRIESLKHESTPKEHYVRVSGRCWGERLFRRVVTKTYVNMKGEAIVKDLLDSYVGLSHVRGGTELVEDTDTTYTRLEYDGTPVWDILKYIAESADKNGVIGFDFRVAPDGKFEFFPRNSKTSPVSLTEKIEVSEYRKDIHRIRNKIMIYGLADKSAPIDKDSWTESLTPSDGVWSCADGNSLSLDGANRAKGAYSIKNERGTAAYCISTFTLNSGKEVNANLYPDFGVFVAADKSYPVKVMLFDTANRTASYGNNLDKGLKVTANEWTFNELNVGKDYADQWIVDDGFDWTQIKRVEFQYFGAAAGGSILWVDGLNFGGCRYSAIREDTASQNAYGLRELTETDEELVTDAECDLRARALLDYFKAPAEYLTLRTTVLDYGNAPLLPGDKVYVYLPNENVSGYFRIESVEYYVDAKTQTLEVTLELGRAPPLLADYLYGTRATTVTVEKLARTKLGKRALRGAAGGALGVHHAAHEVGDETGVPWSEGVGGWDKITGWIAPKYLGPYEDAAAIINFRTRNKAGTEVLDHQFNPTDDGHGVLGSETKKWREINAVYLLLTTDGYMRIRNVGEANPKAQLSADMLQFGPGGALPLDTWLKRVGEGRLEVRYDLLPPMDNSGHIGDYDKAFAYVYAYTVNAGNVYPFEHDTGDLGMEGTCWRHLWLSGYIKSLKGLDTNLLPSADRAWDLGSPTKRWSTLYCNILRIGSCNREYIHPSEQQCVYASSIAWENCPRYYQSDLVFENGFRITEAEKLGLGSGLAFLNPKGKVLMLLDGEGNIHVAGKLKENLREDSA
jgi:hypothetical protein